jgi:hypothetical protein
VIDSPYYLSKKKKKKKMSTLQPQLGAAAVVSLRKWYNMMETIRSFPPKTGGCRRGWRHRKVWLTRSRLSDGDNTAWLLSQVDTQRAEFPYLQGSAKFSHSEYLVKVSQVVRSCAKCWLQSFVPELSQFGNPFQSLTGQYLC